jgi:hypothetical protein
MMLEKSECAGLFSRSMGSGFLAALGDHLNGREFNLSNALEKHLEEFKEDTEILSADAFDENNACFLRGYQDAVDEIKKDAARITSLEFIQGIRAYLNERYKIQPLSPGNQFVATIIHMARAQANEERKPPPSKSSS